MWRSRALGQFQVPCVSLLNCAMQGVLIYKRFGAQGAIVPRPFMQVHLDWASVLASDLNGRYVRECGAET